MRGFSCRLTSAVVFFGLVLAASAPAAFADNSAPPPAVVPAAAAPAPPVNGQLAAYQSSVAEESVRKDTDKIQGEVTQLLTELRINGLSEADAETLDNAATHLRNLSGEDIQKVIDTLQSASMNAEEQGRQKSLVEAFQAQNALTLKMKELAAELANQNSQKELPAKIQNLIARQSANIRQTATLPGGAGVALDATQNSVHGVVTSEQSAIGGDIELLYQALNEESDPTAAATAGADTGTAKAVFDAMNSNAVRDVAGEATQVTTKGPFPGAVSEQKTLRKALMEVLRASLSKLDAVAQLQEAKTQLDQIASDQKDLADVAKQSKIDGATLAERQAKIDDRAAATQSLLQTVSPPAASQLNEAEQAMQKSSDALAQAKNTADTAAQQQAVDQALDKTESLLDQQIASAQKAEDESPADKVAQMQQLQNELNQAEQNNQLSAADLQKLQQDATNLSTPAADAIADAAQQLQQDQSDSSQPPPSDQSSQAGQPPPGQSQSGQPPTPADEAAADKLLAQAGDDLKQDQAGLQAAAQDYQALSQASQALSQAQQETDAGNKSMSGTSPNLSDAAHDLTQAQTEVGQLQQNPASPLPSGTQDALKEASDALKDGTMQAVQSQTANAQAQGQKASAALQMAQAGLADAMEQVKEKAEGQGQRERGEMARMTQMQPGTPFAAAHSQGMIPAWGVRGSETAQVMGGLKPKDRAALAQFQQEKSPPEYANEVQQYMKNLADASASH